jgi:nucleoside-diphosphate-sugar epimerase
MNLLVLGGTRFVGRAIVAEARSRGADITVVSRGESGPPPERVRWVSADRRDPAGLAGLAKDRWDAVIDTWAGAPEVVERSAAQLADAADWYGYVSTRSVYQWPPRAGADESAPLVDVTSGEGYAEHKRGAEIAVSRHFDERCLLARAGLILGPYEDTGRLTWWLSRAAIGGSMVAPAPPDRVWQCIDARDLATFLLDAATAATTGAYNLVCPTSANVTTQRLVTACVTTTGGNAEPVWVDGEVLRRAGVREWEDLPGWMAPDSEGAGMHDCDVRAAIAAGLRCRPIEETVTDTWSWLAEIPPSQRPPRRADAPRRGLSAEQEQAIWWLLGAERH